ncbi:Protein of unknown function [Bacillus mobilis]|nr:Protein of unknown function [Bacillus mobilis]
MVAVHTAVS